MNEPQVPHAFCIGCGEHGRDLVEGEILPRFMPGDAVKVFYCAECWDIVDNADPVTGAFGAGCCDVRRSTAPMGIPTSEL